MTFDTATPLWASTCAEKEPASDALPAGPVDVAIVGGGFTGLSTALHCAQNGFSAHVVEARRIGNGGSGRNVGLVNAAAWLPPAKVRELLGPEFGPKFILRFSEAPGLVFDLIERFQIRCEAVRNGTIHAAHSPKGFADLQNRFAEWRRLGAPVHLLGQSEVREMTGAATFHGGLLDQRAGTINPMGYCRGLARAAKAAGAGITTGARVTGLARENGRWRVETGDGVLFADAAVIATNAYTDSLWPGLQAVFSPIHYLQLATEPMGAEAADILPGRQGVWDTAPIMSNFRRDAAGRLLVGTMGRVFGNSRYGMTRRWARRMISRVFPQLESVRFQHAWHGRIAMTPDHLPRILNLAEGLWSPIGYNGRGITTGTVFGQAMAELLRGMDHDELPLAVTRPAAAPRAKLRSRLFDLAFLTRQAWGSVN